MNGGPDHPIHMRHTDFCGRVWVVQISHALRHHESHENSDANPRCGVRAPSCRHAPRGRMWNTRLQQGDACCREVRATPAREQLGHAQAGDVELRNTETRSLGRGRFRVTGDVVGVAGNQSKATYLCEVARDASDKLRGLKITKLQVVPSTP